jgi:ubiquitin carboxyl-terminal hydrolase 19
MDENYLNVWEKEKEQQGTFIKDNLLGLWMSKITCPLCTKVSLSYDSFTLLPLHLDVKIKQIMFIEIYIVLSDWKKPYLKTKKQFDSTTML